MITRSLRQLRSLRKNQYLPRSELRALQEQGLKRVVTHAYKSVDYYRDLFDSAGITPDKIQGLADLKKIPITTKKAIQHVPPERITAEGIDTRRCVIKHTSGSTGHPLQIFMSPAERDFQILLNLRILIENGLSLRDEVVYIINPKRFPKSKHWFQYLGILRREYLSVFDYPEDHAAALKKLKGDVLYGYPSNLTLLALHAREQGEHGIRPKHIFSVAEALEPKARQVIDTVFGVQTCDILGTIEVGDIAWECEQRNGYHLSADAVIIEFLRDGEAVGSGEEGRIVCTSLYSYTMPFIRYAVDDICVPSDKLCSCGRTLPLLESIKGRANDFVVLPDGKIVASCFLVITMQSFHDVAQYSILQEDRNSLTVNIVAGKNYSSSTGRHLKEEIQKVLQNKLQVSINVLETIPRDASGKIRTIVSRVIPGFQAEISEESGTYIKTSGRGFRP